MNKSVFVRLTESQTAEFEVGKEAGEGLIIKQFHTVYWASDE